MGQHCGLEPRAAYPVSGRVVACEGPEEGQKPEAARPSWSSEGTALSPAPRDAGPPALAGPREDVLFPGQLSPPRMGLAVEPGVEGQVPVCCLVLRTGPEEVLVAVRNENRLSGELSQPPEGPPPLGVQLGAWQALSSVACPCRPCPVSLHTLLQRCRRAHQAWRVGRLRGVSCSHAVGRLAPPVSGFSSGHTGHPELRRRRLVAFR